MRSLLIPLAGVSFATAQIPAFPGAEGYGAYATGGRGGDVYHVTNLNATGPGSFHEGMTTVPASGRTIVFDVSGYIRVTTNGWDFPADKVTIAGQTAPGDGIGFHNDAINLTGDNVVLRHLRFRRGHTVASGDCLDFGANNNTMLDHLSVAFSTDENLSSFGSPPSNLTFQYSLNSWGLVDHSAGGLWDQNTATTHHCLWAYNHTRNPKARPGMLEWINNVTFAWDIGFIMGDSTTSTNWKSNLIGNYFICPPGNTRSLALTSGLIAANGQPNFTIYMEDNLTDNDGDGILDGIDKGYTIAQGTGYAPGTGGLTTGNFGYYKSPTAMPGSSAGVATDPPLLAYKKVASNAGALRLDSSYPEPLRDSVDTIMIDNLLTQVNMETSGQTGISDESQVGGLGTLNSTAAPTNTDQDGTPDQYENVAGMNAGVMDHNTVFSAGDISSGATFFPTDSPVGYTYLEEYLHFMASPHTYVTRNSSGAPSYVDVDLSRYTGGFDKPSLLFTVDNVTGGSISTLNGAGAVLGDGHTVRFTPTQDFTGRAWFDFTVVDGDGLLWTQRFLLMVTQPPVPAVVYVDATDSNTTPASALAATNGIDNKWGVRAFANSATIYESNTENSPQIATTISGLVPGAEYNVFAFFWDAAADPTQNWPIRAGLSPASLTLFCNNTDGGTFPGATYADLASAYSFSTTPLLTEGNRVLMAAPLGMGTANGSGQIVIYLDDYPSTNANDRSWYDGVGYQGTQASMPPTSPIAKAAGAGRIDLSWTAAPGASSYTVKRSTISGGPYTTVAANVTGTSYSDSGLTDGENYRYVIRSVTGGIESADSTEASATTLYPFLQPAGGDGTISIEAEHFDGKTTTGNSWDTVAGAYSGSQAMQGLPDLGNAYTTGYASTAPRLDCQINFTHTGTHYVWLCGSGPTGAFTDDSVHAGLDGAAVTTVENIGNGVFTPSLTWVNDLGAGGVATINITTTGVHTFNVWMREDGFVLDKLLITTNSGYTPAGTGPAETPRGSGSTAPPAAPAAPAADGFSDSEVLLWWSASDGADSYTVKRGTSSGGAYTTVASGLTERVFLDNGLNASTPYFYVVTAENSNGSSSNSTEASATTLGLPPLPPADLAASAVDTETRVDLSWTASAGADSYIVYRSTTPGGPYSELASGVTGTGYNDDEVTIGTTYFYVVSATNSNGEGAQSVEAVITPPALQPIPVTVSNFSGGVTSTSGVADATTGLLFSTPSFSMAGGNAVALLVTAEFASSSSVRNATFAGQAMNRIEVTQLEATYGDKTAMIFYLVNPVSSSGAFQFFLDPNYGATTPVIYAYSQIALNNVVGVADSDTVTSTSTANGTPLDLSYTTTTDGGFVLTSAINDDWNYGRPISVAYGNPDTALLPFVSLASNSGHFHVYGNIASAGNFTDGYYGQYRATAITTVAFNAISTPIVPDLTLSNPGGTMTLNWPADTGWILQTSTTLEPGSWQDVGGSETMSSYAIDPGTATERFFRLRFP